MIAGALIAGAPGGNAAAGGGRIASAAAVSAAPLVSAAAPRQARLARPIPGLLDGVAAISATNVWAVGDDGKGDTQILHWNGHAWLRVAAPNPHPRNDSLTSISAVSPRYIWAVGNGGANALIVRWNGRKWQQVASPVLKGGAAMTGVVALSRTNAWAVGATGGKALTEQWNGRAWRQVPVPSPASAELNSVAASAADNVWAVGEYAYGPQGIHSGVLIVHWNGKAWRRVAAVNPLDSCLLGVSVLSAANAWAVGGFTKGTLVTTPLIEHWNGKEWTRLTFQTPPEGAQLWAVAARSPTLAFAVGNTTPFLTVDSAYLVRWNGHAWREVTSPSQPLGLAFGVGFNSAKSAWLVGVNDSLPFTPAGWTLIEHWNGTAWG
jgi:hypothetical protein